MYEQGSGYMRRAAKVQRNGDSKPSSRLIHMEYEQLIRNIHGVLHIISITDPVSWNQACMAIHTLATSATVITSVQTVGSLAVLLRIFEDRQWEWSIKMWAVHTDNVSKHGKNKEHTSYEDLLVQREKIQQKLVTLRTNNNDLVLANRWYVTPAWLTPLDKSSRSPLIQYITEELHTLLLNKCTKTDMVDEIHTLGVMLRVCDRPSAAYMFDAIHELQEPLCSINEIIVILAGVCDRCERYKFDWYDCWNLAANRITTMRPEHLQFKKMLEEIQWKTHSVISNPRSFTGRTPHGVEDFRMLQNCFQRRLFDTLVAGDTKQVRDRKQWFVIAIKMLLVYVKICDVESAVLMEIALEEFESLDSHTRIKAYDKLSELISPNNERFWVLYAIYQSSLQEHKTRWFEDPRDTAGWKNTGSQPETHGTTDNIKKLQKCHESEYQWVMQHGNMKETYRNKNGGISLDNCLLQAESMELRSMRQLFSRMHMKNLDTVFAQGFDENCLCLDCQLKPVKRRQYLERKSSDRLCGPIMGIEHKLMYGKRLSARENSSTSEDGRVEETDNEAGQVYKDTGDEAHHKEYDGNKSGRVQVDSDGWQIYSDDALLGEHDDDFEAGAKMCMETSPSSRYTTVNQEPVASSREHYSNTEVGAKTNTPSYHARSKMGAAHEDKEVSIDAIVIDHSETSNTYRNLGVNRRPLIYFNTAWVQADKMSKQFYKHNDISRGRRVSSNTIRYGTVLPEIRTTLDALRTHEILYAAPVRHVYEVEENSL
jgi:hypothetical protein